MASISDVETALQCVITAALYPNSAPPSAANHPVKIYPGWPNPQDLDFDMVETSGLPVASHVSTYPLPAGRNTTRHEARWTEDALPAATYGLSVSGAIVTVTGGPPATYSPTNFAIWVNGEAYVYQATSGQTAAQVAAALAALVQVDVPSVTVSGADITIPPSARLGDVAVGVTGSASRQVRREERQFQIAVWTSNPTLRDQIASLFDPILSDTPRLALPDGSTAQLTYQATREDDFVQKQRIYRRSLLYVAEYPTLRTMTAPQIVANKIETPEFPIIDLLDFTDASDAVLTGLI